MATRQIPGVTIEEVFPAPEPALLTGVPVFLGYARQAVPNRPVVLTLWPEFGETFGQAPARGYLADAVRGFFENGGLACYVVRLDDAAPELAALRAGLAAAETSEAIDLVCAPDLLRPAAETGMPNLDHEALHALQLEILSHCQRLGDRFAILDALPTPDLELVLAQRGRLNSTYGALYYPWVLVSSGSQARHVPACGHVAGIYARNDQQVGVQKAPANTVVEAILDAGVPSATGHIPANLKPSEQEQLYRQGVNYLRAFTGRGIRVWGARTLSDDPAWQFVNQRRLFLTVGRWLERFMAELPFEPNNLRLWLRIMRELSAYFDQLYQQGALKGNSPDEAFYVKCDGDTNTAETVRAGMVITEIGLAPAVPGEFIVVRIIHGASGVSVASGE